MAENNEGRIAELTKACEELEKLVETKNSQIAQFKLVTDALQIKPENNPHIEKYRALFEKDYLDFTHEESSLDDEASMALKLQGILHDLETITAFPDLHSKTIGAIGGGFSSGKSSFINSFIQDPRISLATGVKPVTVIPSYVVYSEKPEIRGFSFRGASFPIDAVTYKSIKHELLQDMSFDLKEVIPYMTVSAPMDKKYFGNICLIDTPGYNAPVIGSTSGDKKTAAQFIEKASFLIWLVGLDANGTIGKKDFEFLKELPFGREPGYELYVVLNKAGLRKESDLADILDLAEEFLDDYDFGYTGICAYDSVKKKTFASKKMDILSFLEKKNEQGEEIDQVYQAIDDIFDQYKTAIQRNKNDLASLHRQVSTLRNDVYGAIGFGKNIDAMDSTFAMLLKRYKNDKLDDYLKTVETLRTKFKSCVSGLCTDLHITRRPPRKTEKLAGAHKKFCEKCGTSLGIQFKFCPKCGNSAIIG
jgi:hypothetical protein